MSWNGCQNNTTKCYTEGNVHLARVLKQNQQWKDFNSNAKQHHLIGHLHDGVILLQRPDDVFPFTFKFGNPSEVSIIKPLNCTRKQNPEGFGSQVVVVKWRHRANGLLDNPPHKLNQIQLWAAILSFLPASPSLLYFRNGFFLLWLIYRKIPKISPSMCKPLQI